MRSEIAVRRSFLIAAFGLSATVFVGGCSSNGSNHGNPIAVGGTGGAVEDAAASGGSHSASGGSSSMGGVGGTGGVTSTGSGGTISVGSGGRDGDGSSRDAGTDGALGGRRSVTAAPLNGVYCGDSVADVQQYETWLGRRTDGILGYTGNASWMDFDGSVGWAANLWSAIDRPVFWSVPLIPTGATLEAAAAGDYDDHYRKAAQTLAAFRPGDGKLHIRTGWEFNGNWFPWTAQGGKAANFAGAFQRFVTAFRSVSDRFVFEWNVNLGDSGMNPEDAYPGDGYVDVVGMDFYWNLQYDPADPKQAWDQKVSEKYGLQWHQDFAKSHGKPTSYSEWGVQSDDAAYYIQQAEAWFVSHQVVFHEYWNSNADFAGKLSDGQYPNAGAAYKKVFGP
jgi:hypothetical protein